MARDVSDRDVLYFLRDTNQQLVNEWKTKFEAHADKVKPSMGDIFVGAPCVDAIVCPTNSFGVNGAGGIENAIFKHYGQAVQNMVSEEIDDEFDGEILVGQAVVISGLDRTPRNPASDWPKMNDGDFIRYLIIAPTMRAAQSSNQIPNAYLAFRAVIKAVRDFNRDHKTDQISSVLVPGLGTSGGKMPPKRCAKQMLEAYETHVLKLPNKLFRLRPKSLDEMTKDHIFLCQDDDEQTKTV